jgi:hypothetical protein
MTATLPEFPARPSEVPHDVPLERLVDAYGDHQYQIIVNRQRDDEPSTDALFAHAVMALALLHAVADRLFAARWSTIRDALAADVRRADEVAATCALHGTEVAAGLRSWAEGQVEHGLMAEWEAGVVDLMARSIGGEQ